MKFLPSIFCMICIALMISLPVQIKAQESPNIIPPSPEAAALGKFGEIPVGKYSGIPNINIPLHTLQSRVISVPISLSYHASGIKVEEEASW